MAGRSKASIRKLERVTDCQKDKAFFENKISEAVRMFYFEEFSAETVEQIAKCSQNSWVACMEYVRRSCIVRDDLLIFTSHNLNGNGSGAVVDNEEYNGELIELLCDIYVSLSFLYDKIPSMFGFHVLTGIPRTTLQNWANGAEEVTISSRGFKKKKAVETIRVAKGVSLENLAVTGGKATVGAIAALNNEYWGKQEIEKPQTAVLQSWQLPDLSGKTEAIEVHGEPLPVLRPSVEDAAGLPVLG